MKSQHLSRILFLPFLLVTSLFAQTDLIKNGNFSSGSTNWSLGRYGGSSSGSVVNGEYAIIVSTAGTEHWHVQFTQTGLSLIQGRSYVFSFDAYKGPQNSGNQSMEVNIGQSANPYTSYFGAQSKIVMLTGTKTRYTYTITMVQASDPNTRVEFNCGRSTGGFYIDNVTLVEQNNPLLNATPQTINFGTTVVGDSKESTITLHNNGTSATTITNITSSSGNFSYSLTVPVTIPVSGTATMVITFSSSVPGTYIGSITINSNAIDHPAISISLKGVSEYAGIQYTPAAITFSTSPSHAVSENIIITNTSSSAITWSISNSTPWISVTPGTGTIPAGGNIPCNITATPPSPGTFSGDLTLTHSAANQPSPITIPVSLSVVNGYQPTCPLINNPDQSIDFIRELITFRMRQRDNTNGGFYTNIDRQGNWTGANEKALCGQSRIAYAFVRAFMVTGDEQYLEYAHHALKFLYDHGWNNGWYFITDVAGNYVSHWGHNDWWSFQQHYALIGITAMVEATGGKINWGDESESDHTWLMRGVNSNYTRLWDSNPATKGYFDHANTAWTNKWNKGFTPTVDGVTTHAMIMSMMFDSLNHKQRFIDLQNNIVDHLASSMSHAVAGFPEIYNAAWEIDYSNSSMDIGHGYKTAWVLQRGYLLNPDSTKYRDAGHALMDNLWNHGCYDTVYGAPYSYLNWQTGAITGTNKDFWMVEQGFTSGIMNYYTARTQQQRDQYMRVADGSLNFFLNRQIDPVYGEAYNVMSRDGLTVVDGNKGGLFTAGYHSVELGYYTYLYSSLYYHKRPVQLYYFYPVEQSDRNFKLTPIAIEDNVLKITSVTLDGIPYTDFNSDTRTVHLPSGVGGKLLVTFGFTPPVTHTITASAGTGGAIQPSGAISVNEGSNPTFGILPQEGYRISSVIVDGVASGTMNSYTFSNVTADHTISVEFEEIPTYTISITTSSGGTASPTGTITAYEGNSQTITFNPSAGYSLSTLTVDGTDVPVSPTFTFTNIAENHTISAIFTINNYIIQASSSAGGTITPQGQVTVPHGSSQTFTISPSDGYEIASVLVDGTNAGAVSSYTFSSVTAPHTISASFAVIAQAAYKINTGSSNAVSPFSADQFSTGGTLYSVSSTIDLSGVTDPAPQGVYQSERYGNSTYTIPNLTSGTQYKIRLHFAEIYWTSTGSRLFNVAINGTTVLSNFDIYAVAGARYKAVVREFTATANSSGQISIVFTNVTDNAKISGIEVLRTTLDYPPTIVNEAAATPSQVDAASTALSVLADDDNGEASLTYTWSATGTPPAAVSFSANGTNAAKSTTALFTKSGTYTLQVIIRDQQNNSETSSVVVTVRQTFSSIAVSPSSASVTTSATQQFSASARDQFGDALSTQPSITWTVSDGGTISASGLFTAGTSAGGPFTVTTQSGMISGTASITVNALPQTVYQINTGSNSAATPFSADRFGTGGTLRTVTNAIDMSGVSNPAPQSVYQSERYGNSTYTITGLTAGVQYKVRLHFAELYQTAVGRRVFNVAINGETVLNNFDIYALTGARYKALVREFTATANGSGQISIVFTTITDNATIESIEIIR